MTAYASYFKLQIKRNLQYKASAISGLTTQFFWGIDKLNGFGSNNEKIIIGAHLSITLTYLFVINFIYQKKYKSYGLVNS